MKILRDPARSWSSNRWKSLLPDGRATCSSIPYCSAIDRTDNMVAPDDDDDDAEGGLEQIKEGKN